MVLPILGRKLARLTAQHAGAFVDATIRQALDMTNSMEFTEEYDNPMSGVRRYGGARADRRGARLCSG